MRISQEFDSITDGYTENISRWVPYYFTLIDGLTNHFPTGFQAENILDLGCGNGNITHQLQQHFPNSNYTLVDGSPEMLNACRRRFTNLSATITLQEAYFHELQFPEARFDLVVAGLSIHHLNQSEKQALFHKVFSWLSPSGKFLISDFFVHKEGEDHVKFMEDWNVRASANQTTSEEWQWVIDHHAEFDQPDTLENQKQWLARAGFQNIQLNFQADWWATLNCER